MSFHRPFPEDDDRDRSAGQTLLMQNVPIGREQHIESSDFRRVE